MKVFIFGAGASQASQQSPLGFNVPSPKAPLVDQLFDPQYGDCASNILPDDEFQEVRLGVQSGGSLEKWLTQRWEQIQIRIGCGSVLLAGVGVFVLCAEIFERPI
jgi:hypothetical protein